MSEEYIDVSKACTGTYLRADDPRRQELLQNHKSTWEANSKGGEPNHWEERK